MPYQLFGSVASSRDGGEFCISPLDGRERVCLVLGGMACGFSGGRGMGMCLFMLGGEIASVFVVIVLVVICPLLSIYASGIIAPSAAVDAGYAP